MNRQCKSVRDLLLDMAYVSPGVLEEPAVSKSQDVQDSKADRTNSDSLTTQKTSLSEAEIQSISITVLSAVAMPTHLTKSGSCCALLRVLLPLGVPWMTLRQAQR